MLLYINFKYAHTTSIIQSSPSNLFYQMPIILLCFFQVFLQVKSANVWTSIQNIISLYLLKEVHRDACKSKSQQTELTFRRRTLHYASLLSVLFRSQCNCRGPLLPSSLVSIKHNFYVLNVWRDVVLNYTHVGRGFGVGGIMFIPHPPLLFVEEEEDLESSV